MKETELITNEVMDRHQIGDGEYVHANILGEGPNVSVRRNNVGTALFEGARNALACEVFAALVIWGAWELHRPIMILFHWLVSHAH